MPLPRDLTKEQKAELFKEHTTKYLNPDEAKQVKVALALFMKDKNPGELVDRLREVLTTPDKFILFDTIGLFIPTKFFDEYQALWNTDGGDEASDNTPNGTSLSTATSRGAPLPPPRDVEAAKQREAAAAQAEAEQAREYQRRAREAEAAAAARERDEAARLQQEQDEADRRQREEEEEAAAAAAAAAAARQQEEEDAKRRKEQEAAERRAEVQRRAEAAAAREEEEAAAAAAEAEARRIEELDREATEAEAMPPQESDENDTFEARDDEAAEMARRKLSERRAERRKAEEEAEKKFMAEQAEQSTLVRSARRGTIMGRAGGVSALKARLSGGAASAERGGGRQTREAAPTTAGHVRKARMSHIEAVDKASREGPIDKVELLVKAEEAAGEKYGGKIVIYTTSVTGIMETKIKCKEMRAIFQRLRVRYEERNIYMDKSLSQELEIRLPGAQLPQAFFNGKHLGGFDEILKMNETGALQKLTRAMEKIDVNITGDCQTCAGEGFTLCQWCGGNKGKSMAIEFKVPTRQTAFLKCTACNDNGLMMCPDCMTQVSGSWAQ